MKEYLLISVLCLCGALFCLTAAFAGIAQRMIAETESISLQYGYCLAEDSRLWKNINMFKVGK